MKLSRLIEIAQEALKEGGDLDVVDSYTEAFFRGGKCFVLDLSDLDDEAG